MHETKTNQQQQNFKKIAFKNMKNIVIIGGSKGIGNAILLQQLDLNQVHNISRNAPAISHPNLKHYSLDV